MIVEKSQVAENMPNPDVDIVIPSANIWDMAKRKKKPEPVTSIRFNARDKAIIEAGKEKHGANATGIIRMALRRFAESEGIEVRAS